MSSLHDAVSCFDLLTASLAFQVPAVVSVEVDVWTSDQNLHLFSTVLGHSFVRHHQVQQVLFTTGPNESTVLKFVEVSWMVVLKVDF